MASSRWRLQHNTAKLTSTWISALLHVCTWSWYPVHIRLNGIVTLGSNMIDVNGACDDVDAVFERVGEQLRVTLGH